MTQRPISIHALREEGDIDAATLTLRAQIISIHALREEGDQHFWKKWLTMEPFLSTPSARRATTVL